MICDPRQRLRIALDHLMCAKSRSRPRGRARTNDAISFV
jgi:hypothetical protein